MIYRELTEKEYADAEDRILYEDNHLLVVNKRVGEIVQADRTEDETLADLYKAFIARRNAKEGGVFLGIPHRLDRPVSGVTVFAKTSKALERMNAMFRDGEVHKFYWALVCRRPEAESGELSDWLIRNEQQNKQNQPQPAQGEQDKEQGKQQGLNEQEQTGEQKADKKPEEQQEAQAQAAEVKDDNKQDKYDEKVQARAQQYRDIPEDTGGLLRAFIQKEYRKNRYKE